MQSEGRWYRWCRVLVLCVLSQGWGVSRVPAADRARPFRIGALTASWGPPPQVVGLRDGLLALDYREDHDFVLGVRFTQGDVAALPEAARQLVSYGVDLLVVDRDDAAKAAQQATMQIPIVFARCARSGRLGLDPELCQTR